MNVYRVAPSWRMPVGAGFYVEPGGGVQNVDGEWMGTGSLTVGVETDEWHMWAGGKGGREERPAYLDTPVIHNIDEPIFFGAWLGFERALDGPWRLLFTAEYERLGSPSESVITNSNALFFTFGVHNALH